MPGEAPELAPRGLRNGERAAVLVSECQRAMTDPSMTSLPGLANAVVTRAILAKIAMVASAARAKGLPVVYCTLALRRDLAGTAVSSPLMASISKGALREASEAAAIDAVVEPMAPDLIVSRHSGITSFHGTELDTTLRALKVETVILTGVSTNVALPGTAIEAVNRGYNVVLPEDCTAGGSPQTHQFMIREFFPLLTSVTTADRVAAALSAR